MKCVAGENLYVSLEGIDLSDAALSFSGVAANVTLVRYDMIKGLRMVQVLICGEALTGDCFLQVRDGALVSQDLPDYWDRVQTHSMSIEIKHVNYSDEGHYTLRDRRERIVSVTRMDLTGIFPGFYLLCGVSTTFPCVCVCVIVCFFLLYFLSTASLCFHKECINHDIILRN